MSRPHTFSAAQLLASVVAPVDPAHPDVVGPRTGRDWAVDIVGFILAVAFGVLILI